MNIQLMSDLHLEMQPEFVPVLAPNVDVLVLAGDIGAQPDSPFATHGQVDWCLRRFSPRLTGWRVPVLYIPGNHEYDGQEFSDCYARLRDIVEALGLVWLEGESYVLRGVRFVGSTLWSDFDCFGDPLASMTENMRIRTKCFRAANYFLEKSATHWRGELFDAAAMREQALRSQARLNALLSVPHAGTTVVVTHFAPSLRSHDPRYGLTPGTAGFCNALDPLVATVDLWLHGHLHCPSDYRIGKCRVVANPLGYAEQGEQNSFNHQCVVTV